MTRRELPGEPQGPLGEGAQSGPPTAQGQARLQRPTVDELIGELAAGQAPLEDVAAEFTRRDWSMPAMTLEQLMRGDEEPPRANYWETVEAARQTGRITDDQYRVLNDARGVVVWH